METESAGEGSKDKLEKLVKEFLGPRYDFSFDSYLKLHGITSFSGLNMRQKRQFTEDIIERVIRPATSGGKASMARAEMMSILKIGVEPWKITATYVPSPREYLLETEMKDEFRKLKHRVLYKEIAKYDLKTKPVTDDKTKHEIVDSVVYEIFGSMPLTTLAYAKQLVDQYPVEWTINRNLSAYMSPKEASEDSRGLIHLLNIIMKTNVEDEPPGKSIDEGALSKNLMNYFNDTNQLLLRRLKNEFNVFDTQLIQDKQKQQILHGIMAHYFGSMSKRFLEMECEKMGIDGGDAEATDKLRLINAIIYDCLHSSMSTDDAKRAHNEINKFINP